MKQSRVLAPLLIALLGAVCGWVAHGSLSDDLDFGAVIPAPDLRQSPQMPKKARRTDFDRLEEERDRLASRNRALAASIRESQARVKEEQARNHALATNLEKNRQAVAGFTRGVSSRMNRAIIRNTGSAGAGLIPIFGDAADAAATAVDVAEYCQISHDIDNLNAKVGNNVTSFRGNDACKAVKDKQWLKWPRFKLPW